MRLTTLRPRIAPLDTRRVKPPPKTAAPIYMSAEWKALIRHIIKERGYRCEDPEHKPTASLGRIYGDHIIELSDGGAPLDPNNIMLRCAPCHGRKTAKERAKRARPELK